MSQYEQSHTGDFSTSQLSHSRSGDSSTVTSDRSRESACDGSKVGFGPSRKTPVENDPRGRPVLLEDSDLDVLTTGISGVYDGGREIIGSAALR